MARHRPPVNRLVGGLAGLALLECVRMTSRTKRTCRGCAFVTLAGFYAQAPERALPSDPPTVNSDRTNEFRPMVEAIDLSDESFDIWREFILPDEAELAWEKIPWLPTFRDGMVRASAERKPLLLWAMNGHPLGCT